MLKQVALSALILFCTTAVQADYPPYRYFPTGENRVLLVGSGQCGCGSRGSRMEYAPARYQPIFTNLPTPRGLAGGVATGGISEYRFIDLQPRYRYDNR